MRFVLLTAIALSLTTVGIRVLFYRPLLAMPGGLAFVLAPMVAQLVYAVLIVWATGNGRSRQRVVLIATSPGLIAAAVQIVHMAAENFIRLGAPSDGIVTMGFMLATFLIWGAAGYRCARSTGSIASGTLAGSWSAIVTMSLVVAAGLVLELYWLAPKPDYVATWAEYKRSGWTDVHAFIIANTLDSALSHLTAGPIIGAAFGGLAGVITKVHRIG